MSDTTIASIGIPVSLDFSKLKTDFTEVNKRFAKEIVFQARFNQAELGRQIAEIQELASKKKIKFQTTLDLSGVKKQLDDLEAQIKRINNAGQPQANAPLKNTTKDAEKAAISLQKLSLESVKANAALAKAKGLDASQLQKEAGQLAALVKSKEQLSRVQKLNLDPSQLERAKVEIEKTRQLTNERFEIKPKVNTSGIASSLKSSLSSIGQGIAQGIGQQITFSIQNAVSGVGSGVVSGIGSSLMAAGSLEKTSNTLGLVTGSATKAAEALRFVDTVSRNLNLPIETLRTQFANLSAATRGTNLEGEETRNVFMAVAQAGRVYGLTNEELKGSLLALQQMVSKGKISAEELRGQLGERLPGAFQIAARAMGVTTAELDKMMSTGQLIAEDFLPRFARQLASETSGGVAGSLKTMSGGVDRAQNAIYRLQEQFGKGLSPVVTEGANFLSQTLEALENNNGFADLNAEANRFAEYLRQNPKYAQLLSSALNDLLESGLKVLVDTSEEFLKYLEKNPKAIEQAIEKGVEFGKELGSAAKGALDIANAFVQVTKEISNALGKLQELTKQQQFFKDSQGSYTPVGQNNGMDASGQIKSAGGSDRDVSEYRQNVHNRIGGLGLFGSPNDIKKIEQEELQKILSRFGNRVGSGAQADQLVGAVISILESPTRQGRVDVAQVLANRVQNNYGGFGSSIRDQAFAPGQFEPFFRDINRGEIRDYNSAISALRKKGYSAKQASEALDQFFRDVNDSAKVQDSQGKVANRAHFKGTTMYQNMGPGDFLRNRGENFFHYDGSDRNFRTGSIPSLFAGGIRAQTYGPPAPFGPPSARSRSSQFTSLDRPAPNLNKPEERAHPVIGNYPVTSGYGMRKHPVYGDMRFHDGIDVGTPTGTKIVSPGSGTVIRSGEYGGYGKLIEVKFDDKTTAFFAHMSALALKEGAKVKPGTLLGLTGATGTGTGPHLHFGASDAFGKSINPKSLLNGKRLTAPTRTDDDGFSALGDFDLQKQIEDDRKRAQEKAQQALVNRDRRLEERINAERKQRDERLKLRREREDRVSRTEIERERNPLLRDDLQFKLEKQTETRVLEDRIQQARDQRADFARARDLKLGLKKSGKPVDELSGIDFTSQIKGTDDLIKNLELIKKSVTEPINAKRESALLDVAKQQAEAFKQTQEQLSELDAQYLDDTPQNRYIASLRQISEGHKAIAEELAKQIETQRTLLKIQDSPENRQQLTLLEEAQRRNEATFLRSKDKLDRDTRKAEANRLLEARQTDFSMSDDILSARIGLGKTFGLDTRELEKDQAFSNEQTRFEAQIRGYQQLRDENRLTADEMERLTAKAKELNELNLANITEQFNEFHSIFRDGIQPAFTGFFSDVIKGTTAVGDAFVNMISKIADSLLNFGLNKLMGGLFGGLMGGNGGLFGGLNIDLGTPLLGFSQGGLIPGTRSRADDQLILAQKGEAILTHKGVDLLGIPAINAINKGLFPKFADGGPIDRPTLGLAQMPTIETPKAQSRIIGGSNVANQTVNISVSIDNSGGAQVSGDQGDLLGAKLSNAVKSILIQESRPGGIIARRG